MFKDITAFVLLAICGLFFVVEPVQAASRSDVLTGVTTAKRRVINNDIQQAKQRAVQDALELAVQNGFSRLVSREVFASHLDFFYNRILKQTSDYILAYRVLGEVEEKGYFMVGVETKVDLSQLEKKLIDARIINANKNKPTLLFFIAEQTPNDMNPKYWWGIKPDRYNSVAERTLINQLIQERFFILGTGPERPDPSYYNVRFNSIYDITSAKDLGREMKADMIVVGQATSSESINRMGEQRTFNGRINLEAYHLETGEKAVVSQVETAVQSDNPSSGYIYALTEAGALSAADLKEKLDKYWVEQLRREHSFDVRIEGMEFLPRFIALKKRFQQIPEIENMQPKEMGSNFALLEMFYKVLMNAQARALKSEYQVMLTVNEKN